MFSQHKREITRSLCLRFALRFSCTDDFYLAKGFALDIPLEVATITAQSAVVVGRWQPIV